jgi:hypothetical protein
MYSGSDISELCPVIHLAGSTCSSTFYTYMFYCILYAHVVTVFYMYIYICIRTCICIYIYIYIYTPLYISIYIRILYFDIGLAGHGDRKKHSQEPRALRQEIWEMRKKIGFPFPGPRTDGSHPSPWVWRLGTGLYTVYVPGAVRNLVSPAAALRSCSPHCNSPEPSAGAVTLGWRVTLPVLASQSPIRFDSGVCTVGVLRTVDIR